jgi:hypothetical protein
VSISEVFTDKKTHNNQKKKTWFLRASSITWEDDSGVYLGEILCEAGTWIEVTDVRGKFPGFVTVCLGCFTSAYRGLVSTAGRTVMCSDTLYDIQNEVGV